MPHHQHITEEARVLDDLLRDNPSQLLTVVLREKPLADQDASAAAAAAAAAVNEANEAGAAVAAAAGEMGVQGDGYVAD